MRSRTRSYCRSRTKSYRRRRSRSYRRRTRSYRRSKTKSYRRRRYSLRLLGRGKKQKSLRNVKTKQRPEKKVYTLVNNKGYDIGGDYKGITFKAAAKKAAKNFLPGTRPGQTKICLRQKSRGLHHNVIKCFKVTQTMRTVKDSDPFWLQGKTKMAVKIATEITIPNKIKNMYVKSLN